MEKPVERNLAAAGESRYIDCSAVPLTYFRDLALDVMERNRTRNDIRPHGDRHEARS